MKEEFVLKYNSLVYAKTYRINLYQHPLAASLRRKKQQQTIISYDLPQLISPPKCRQRAMFPDIFMPLWEFLREIKASRMHPRFPYLQEAERCLRLGRRRQRLNYDSILPGETTPFFCFIFLSLSFPCLFIFSRYFGLCLFFMSDEKGDREK